MRTLPRNAASINRTEHGFHWPGKSQGISLQRALPVPHGLRGCPRTLLRDTPLCRQGKQQRGKHPNKISEGSCPCTSSSYLTSVLTRGKFHPTHSASPGNFKLWLCNWTEEGSNLSTWPGGAGKRIKHHARTL